MKEETNKERVRRENLEMGVFIGGEVEDEDNR